MSTPYKAGMQLALEELGVEKTAVFPEEYNNAGQLGAMGGGVLGAGLGGVAGNLIGKHVGEATRDSILGIDIPGSGIGEHYIKPNTGPLIGELLGAGIGAGIGGHMGQSQGHLKALRRSSPPLLQDPSRDPRLMAYLMGR